MNHRFLKVNVQKLLQQRNAALTLSAGMMLSNIILCTVVFFSNERVVIVPPDIKKSFWTETSRVSTDYLEEMSLFFAAQILDVCPGSAAFQRDVVLRYVDPAYHNALKKRLIEEEETYKTQQISTSFKPVKIEVDAARLEAKLTGDLQSFVGRERVKQTRETYHLKFAYRSGRLLLTNFQLLESKYE